MTTENYESTTWPWKYQAARITPDIDFAPGLSPGETLVSVQIFITTVRGVDATPLNLLDGGLAIKGSRLFQRLKAGVTGCSYLIEYHGTTSNGNVIIIARVLPIKAIP